jgi:hypothetical protein
MVNMENADMATNKLILFDDGLIAEINDWRRRQEDLPTFSDAVRQLVRLGLRTTAPRRKRDDDRFR